MNDAVAALQRQPRRRCPCSGHEPLCEQELFEGQGVPYEPLRERVRARVMSMPTESFPERTVLVRVGR